VFDSLRLANPRNAADAAARVRTCAAKKPGDSASAKWRGNLRALASQTLAICSDEAKPARSENY
jgi:hypothetical protein